MPTEATCNDNHMHQAVSKPGRKKGCLQLSPSTPCCQEYARHQAQSLCSQEHWHVRNTSSSTSGALIVRPQSTLHLASKVRCTKNRYLEGHIVGNLRSRVQHRINPCHRADRELALEACSRRKCHGIEGHRTGTSGACGQSGGTVGG